MPSSVRRAARLVKSNLFSRSQVLISMYGDAKISPPSVSTETHIRRNGQKSQRVLPKKDNTTPIGKRLLAAFKEEKGIEDKETIAKILGYDSKGAVYKVITGKMELKYDALVKFKNYTNRTIDWLLTNDDRFSLIEQNPIPSIDLNSPNFVIDVIPSSTGIRLSVQTLTANSPGQSFDVDEALRAGSRDRSITHPAVVSDTTGESPLLTTTPQLKTTSAVKKNEQSDSDKKRRSIRR